MIRNRNDVKYDYWLAHFVHLDTNPPLNRKIFGLMITLPFLVHEHDDNPKRSVRESTVKKRKEVDDWEFLLYPLMCEGWRYYFLQLLLYVRYFCILNYRCFLSSQANNKSVSTMVWMGSNVSNKILKWNVSRKKEIWWWR